MEVVVGPDEGEGLVDGGVALGGNQGVLELVSFRGVVVNVVGGNLSYAEVLGDIGKRTVACRVPFQEVLLKLHVDGLRPVPLQV